MYLQNFLKINNNIKVFWYEHSSNLVLPNSLLLSKAHVILYNSQCESVEVWTHWFLGTETLDLEDVLCFRESVIYEVL
jgi:hypothetical protein